MSADKDNGHFHFNLILRYDREGNPFLFAGLRFLNGVLFVRPDPRNAGLEATHWQAVLKPFISPNANNEYDWPE